MNGEDYSLNRRQTLGEVGIEYHAKGGDRPDEQSTVPSFKRICSIVEDNQTLNDRSNEEANG